MIILDETGVRNLGIQTVVAEEKRFEETLFTLGRIEAVPALTARVSSRIVGRLVELGIAEGDEVKALQSVAKIESRQPGNNPPVIDVQSPLGGLVTRSEFRLGDPVGPDVAIAEITDLSEVYAVARVPENYVGYIHAGTRARIRILALGERWFTGELLRFGTVADREGGTLDVIFKLKNQDNLIRPGMRAEFQIVLNEKEEVLLLPNDAIQGPPSARHVYVTDFSVPNTFVKVPVSVGRSSGGMTEILGGIYVGDEVVTQGAYTLGFVGDGGTMSLKEALDAAHGHAHNEDGSEMTSEQLEESHQSPRQGHSHEDDHEEVSLRELFFMISSGVLAVLLVVSSLRRRNDNGSSKE